MIKTILTSLLVPLLVLSSCKHAVEPTDLDYHNKILFSSSRSGKEQLYMMDTDGTDIRQLTFGPYTHGGGRWSPDAKQIAALTDDFSNTACYATMVVMNADGTSRRNIGCGSQMAWSRDGKKILFVHCPSCEIGVFNAALYIIDLDGKNRSLLSSDFAGEAAFSPDGSTVAFVYANRSDGIPQTVIKLMDYPGFANVRSVGPVGAVDPAWSPSGKEIAFSMKPEGRAFYDIFIMDATGQAIQRVTNHQSAEHFYFPRWSSDGNRIAFVSHLTDGSARSFLYVVNRDGSNLRRVLDDPTVTSCDWSW